MPLPGLGAHPRLTTGSALLVVAAPLAGGSAHVVFLCPQAGPDPAAGHVRVTVLACASQPPHQLVAAVVVAPPPDLRGLTCRELQILGLLIEGWTNARIAAALVICATDGRCPHGTHPGQARRPHPGPTAVRALGPGLYVPPGLASIRA